MTLLVSVFAAVITTAIWYKSAQRSEMKIGVLCVKFWGASLRGLVYAIFEYAELKAAYFTPDPADMLNDLFLGLSVVALALVIWLVVLLVKDPKGVVKNTLLKKSAN